VSTFGEFRHGALYVVEQARSQDSVQKALRGIDDRLFLERQVGFDGQPVWCVCVALDGDQPPVTILEWRDEDGSPIPDPSDRLVDRVRRMERDGARLTASVIEKNRRFQEQKVKDMETTITEMAKEHGKLSTRALMPVGNNHKLLVARRRKRNMGEWSF
jgi:hypothetical protein